ncbi:integrating conjugative element protein [Pseudomonas putida]|uniref:integrating conjugative element protein n=1 Tax=Pseudomonas putida TaxID=303 RepID=UPI0023648FCC|nr:integrating conjugative element protein [Pseudomonas putida]MDD2052758.1 integrating conjugative element protein [Pseudomonas putida]
MATRTAVTAGLLGVLVALSSPRLPAQPPPPTPGLPRATAITTADMLPVVSPGLTPGLVKSRAIRLVGLISPLFLVGDDLLSLEWLARHQPHLQRLGAIGWAVNVADREGLERLRQAAGGLAVLPIPGDDLASRLTLQHYPALITASRIEQ